MTSRRTRIRNKSRKSKQKRSSKRKINIRSSKKSRTTRTRLNVSSSKDVLCKRRIPTSYTQAISTYKEVQTPGNIQDKYYLELNTTYNPYKDLEALEQIIREYVDGDCYGITIDDELLYSSDTAHQTYCIRKRNFENLFRTQISSKPSRYLLDPVIHSSTNRIIRIFMHGLGKDGAFLQLIYNKTEDAFIAKWFENKTSN